MRVRGRELARPEGGGLPSRDDACAQALGDWAQGFVGPGVQSGRVHEVVLVVVAVKTRRLWQWARIVVVVCVEVG